MHLKMMSLIALLYDNHLEKHVKYFGQLYSTSVLEYNILFFFYSWIFLINVFETLNTLKFFLNETWSTALFVCKV